MYLPAAEMQMYKGQLACQYCIMDSRDEDRRIERSMGQGNKPGKLKVGERREQERCERCGQEMYTVYYFNGRRLCNSCTENEKDNWENKGGERPPMVVFRVPKERSLVSSIVKAVEKRIGEAIKGKARKKAREKKKDLQKKERPKEKEQDEKDNGPMTEGLQKKDGLKYMVSDYKDDSDHSLAKTKEKAKKRRGKKKKSKKR